MGVLFHGVDIPAVTTMATAQGLTVSLAGPSAALAGRDGAAAVVRPRWALALLAPPAIFVAMVALLARHPDAARLVLQIATVGVPALAAIATKGLARRAWPGDRRRADRRRVHVPGRARRPGRGARAARPLLRGDRRADPAPGPRPPRGARRRRRHAGARRRRSSSRSAPSRDGHRRARRGLHRPRAVLRRGRRRDRAHGLRRPRDRRDRRRDRRPRSPAAPRASGS